MDLVGDERAQSIQIGAVLLFAVLIIAFSSYQAFVVPQQNRQVEFDHNQQVQTQMQDLRNAIVSASGRTDERAVSVQLGTRYPSRAIAQNPGPPSGSLRTVGTTDESVALEIANAQADGETGDFWNQTQSYNTGGIAYQPQYNVYTGPPTTVYEHTVLYNSFRAGNVTISNQSFIDGNDISLVVVNGSLSRSSSQSTSVDVRPVSVSTQTVQLEDDGSNIEITFQSLRSADYWEFLETTQSSAVTDVSGSGTTGTDDFYDITIQLVSGQTYNLEMTEIGVGTRVTDEDTAYLTDTDGDGTTLSQGETTELTLEVRDRLNNPPANASATTVEAEVADGGSLDSTSQTPDEDGEVTFEYTAPSSSTGEQEIRFSYRTIGSGYDASTPQNVSMTVDVQSSSGSGDSAPYSLSWTDPTQSGVTCPSGADGVCTINTETTTVADLTVDTDPTATGASVEYSLNNSTVGSFSSNSGSIDDDGQHTTQFSAAANGSVQLFATSGGGGDSLELVVEEVVLSDIGETGRVTTSGSGTQTVSLTNSFENPVVIARPVSFDDSQPMYTRVLSVSGDSFDYRLDTFDGDTPGTVTFHYLVVEQGTHELADGTVIEAGSGVVGDTDTTFSFDHGFSTAPVVFSQPQTENDAEPVVVRQSAVGNADFDVRLESDEEGGQNHPDETVGYVAIESTSGTSGTTPYETGTTGNNVLGVDNSWTTIGFSESYDSSPAFFAQMQTRDGVNTAWERYRNLDSSSVEVVIDEEQTNDDERSHNSEDVGYFAFGELGSVTGLFSADTVDVTGNTAPTGTGDSGVVFNLSNTGNTDADLTGIAVNDTSTSATEVRYNSGAELSTNQTGSFEGTITVDGSAVTLDTADTIPSGDVSQITLQQFRDGGPVDMADSDVNVTLYFSDGSERLANLTVGSGGGGGGGGGPPTLDSPEADSGTTGAIRSQKK